MSYWDDPRRHGWDELWQNHPAVRAWINLRVTGDPDRWPIERLARAVPGRLPFRRAVSIGCGVGNLERSLVSLGLVTRVTGVDASLESVGSARRAAERGGMTDRIAYVAADARSFLESCRGLDAVFFHSSLHHFDRLDELLGLVRAALAPGGILWFDEYVGPARGEWTWRHLWRWNRLYWSLPAAVRRTKIIRRPVNREDPTEAVASSDILPAVEAHFRVVDRRDYGGNLLAPVYPSLLRPDQTGGPSPAMFDAAVATLLAAEERLLAREDGFHSVIVAEPM